jgi:transcriptional regulator with XRE-family HTH domain
MPPSLRRPAPRALAPGYPKDELRTVDVRTRLARHFKVSPGELDRGQLAAVVRRLREAQRLVRFLSEARGSRTLTDLADRIGVSADTVERMMAGRAWPAADLVGLLAEEVERPLAFTREGVDVNLADERSVAVQLRDAQEAERARQAVLDATTDAVVRRLRDDPELLRRVRVLHSETTGG